jgi:hypothetical protein
MKHKRSANGFAVHLALISIILVAAIAFSGWHVIKQHNQDRFINQDVSQSDLVPVQGVIDLSFKDGVSFQQAQSLISSFGLSVDKPGEVETNFIPKSYRGINDKIAAAVMSKLGAYTEVKSVLDDSADLANNRAGPGEKWVEVIWQENVTFDRIKQIQAATGYGLSNQPQAINRTIYGLRVPNGQEGSYVKKFKQNPLIKDANREMTCPQTNPACGADIQG